MLNTSQLTSGNILREKMTTFNGYTTSAPDMFQISLTEDNSSINNAVSTSMKHGTSLTESFTLFLWQFLPPPVILLGTTGNILSFLVMRRRRLRDTRMSLCLRLLAVVDTIVLWTGYLRYWIWKTFGIDIRTLHNIVCKSHSFVVHVSSQFSAWIIVCIAVDRLMVVYFPYFTKNTFTKLKTVLGISLIGLVLSLLNLHFFWSLQIDSEGLCRINQDITWLADFFRSIWPWMDLSLYSIVPSVLITVSNAAIIIQLKASRRQNTSLSRKQHLSRSRISSMTYTLLTISLMFLTTTLPICAFMVLHTSHLHSLTHTQWMWFAVVNFLSYLNAATNFILYLVSSSFFRSELHDMLCCGKVKAKEQLALEGPLVASSTNNGAARKQGETPEGASSSQGNEALITPENRKD